MEEVIVEVAAGRGDVRPGYAEVCASVVKPCVVADWKSSKSSSPAVPDSMAPNSSAALDELVALPFDVDVAAGSSPKSNRSCSGSFLILASLLIVLREAARRPERDRAWEAVDGLAADELPSSSSSSYSSNLSLRR